MKNLKTLPLAAIITGLLVGCGDSGGGGGGVPAPVQTKLSMSFVKAELQDIGTATSNACKIYQRERTETTNNNVTTVNTKILIAKPVADAIDSFLSVVYSDANGVPQGEEVFVDNGKVDIILENIPEGGFVSFKEKFGPNDVYVTSFTQAFLETYKAELNNLTLTAVTAIPNLVCSTSTTNLAEVTKSGVRYLNTKDDTQGDSAVLPFFFHSSLEKAQSNDSELTVDIGLQELSNDITAITQYRQANSTASLFQYGFDDWNTGNIEMVYTGTEEAITRPSNVDYNNADIGIVYKDTSKTLSSVPKTESKYFHPSTLRAGEQWFAKTSAVPQTNWTSSLTLPIDETWALSLDESTLFNASTLSSNPVTLENHASGALQVTLTDNITIQDSENGVQRISITPNSNLSNIKLHALYSFVNDTVILPNISATNASDLNAFTLQQNYWFSTENNDLSARFIMDHFNGTAATDESVDSHGIMIDEAERTRLQAQSDAVKHFALTRSQ